MSMRIKQLVIILTGLACMAIYYNVSKRNLNSRRVINKLDFIRTRDFIRLDCQNIKRIGNEYLKILSKISLIMR